MIEHINCSDLNTSPRIKIDTNASEQYAVPFPSKIASIYNLPIEIKQKIAFNFDAKDYASLRLTGKVMSESLDSFSVMNNKLKQGVSGEAEKNTQKIIFDKLIRNLLNNNQRKEINLALRNCFSRPHNFFENSTEVGTKYLPDIYNHQQNRIYEAIESCRKGITSIHVSGSSVSFNPKINPKSMWECNINFNNSVINKKNLNDIFSSFNNVYCNTKSSERFVVAHLASTLLNYWSETPPSNVDKNDMNHISLVFSELFRAGDHVVKLLREST